MNGPEVIEQEAGIEELDSGDRRPHLVDDRRRGARRGRAADTLVEDDTGLVRGAVLIAFARSMPKQHRTEDVDGFLARLAQVNPDAIDPDTLRTCRAHHERHAFTRRALADALSSSLSSDAKQSGPVRTHDGLLGGERALHRGRARSAEPLPTRDG